MINKAKPGTKEKLSLTPTPVKPLDIAAVDTIGPLPKSTFGNKYALTLICDLIKYLVTLALPDKSAKTAIFESFVFVYGTMCSIKSDLVTEFKNEIILELCKLLQIKHDFQRFTTMKYWARSNAIIGFLMSICERTLPRTF